jgi:hypothetical protein
MPRVADLPLGQGVRDFLESQQRTNGGLESVALVVALEQKAQGMLAFGEQA